MNFLPIGLEVRGRRILVVGGGKVALQKLATLVPYAADILVAAPHILEAIRHLPVKCLERTFGEDLLEGVFLVYACTDDRGINRKVGEAARERGIPANVADDPQACDFISPAVYREGNMSVAVSSNGMDARRSVAWRDAIRRLAESGGLPAAPPDVSPHPAPGE
jgi:siroheme synthase-like protein